MRVLTLIADRQLMIAEIPAPAPPPPGAAEVRVESRLMFGKIVVGF